MKKTLALLAILTLFSLSGCNSTQYKVVCGDFDTGWSTYANIYDLQITWRKNNQWFYRALPENESCTELRRKIK